MLVLVVVVMGLMSVWAMVRRKKKAGRCVFDDGAGPLRAGLIIAHPDDEVHLSANANTSHRTVLGEV